MQMFEMLVNVRKAVIPAQRLITSGMRDRMFTCGCENRFNSVNRRIKSDGCNPI